MKVALAQINPIVGDLLGNARKITDHIKVAKAQRADLVVFPEMALLGYPPEDLLTLPAFVEGVEKALDSLAQVTQGIAAIVGCVRKNPLKKEKPLHNSAAILIDGKLIGFYDKILLPDYDVFSERRYFEPGKQATLFVIKGKKVAVTICEDIWQHSEVIDDTIYSRDIVVELAAQKPDMVINLSSSPFHIGRPSMRFAICEKAAATLQCPLLLCNQVGGNDSLIFDGYSCCINSAGKLVAHAQGFTEDLLLFDTAKPLHQLHSAFDNAEILFSALVLGVRDYFFKTGFRKAILGLSGGIDSTLVAAIAAQALGKENVLALLLPSRYSSKESAEDAKELVQNLGIEWQEMSIEPLFKEFLSLLAPSFAGRAEDITEENLQSRIRGMILMAFSNKFGYLLLNTGNKSEMAMGYMTLYGDMCGALSVLGDVSKDRIFELCRLINRKEPLIPPRILSKPPSAELAFEQKDTDSLPPYPIVDIVLAQYVENHRSPQEIAEEQSIPLSLVTALVRRIHLNEYKRRQAPPVLRVTKKALTAGRRFPIAQYYNI